MRQVLLQLLARFGMVPLLQARWWPTLLAHAPTTERDLTGWPGGRGGGGGRNQFEVLIGVVIELVSPFTTDTTSNQPPNQSGE